jgi:hypothetical protein
MLRVVHALRSSFVIWGLYKGEASYSSVAIDYMHAVSLKALPTIAQCFEDANSTRSHAYDVVNGVPCPMRIVLEPTRIAQGRSELQYHCHEVRVSNLAPSRLQDRSTLLKRCLYMIIRLRCSVPCPMAYNVQPCHLQPSSSQAGENACR